MSTHATAKAGCHVSTYNPDDEINRFHFTGHFSSWAKHAPLQSSLSRNYSPRKKEKLKLLSYNVRVSKKALLGNAVEKRDKQSEKCMRRVESLLLLLKQSIPSSLYALSTCILISNYIPSNLTKKTTARIKIHFTNVAYHFRTVTELE
jgi:hypothetical protein